LYFAHDGRSILSIFSSWSLSIAAAKPLRRARLCANDSKRHARNSGMKLDCFRAILTHRDDDARKDLEVEGGGARRAQ
jgi:hypothetical protein